MMAAQPPPLPPRSKGASSRRNSASHPAICTPRHLCGPLDAYLKAPTVVFSPRLAPGLPHTSPLPPLHAEPPETASQPPAKVLRPPAAALAMLSAALAPSSGPGARGPGLSAPAGGSTADPSCPSSDSCSLASSSADDHQQHYAMDALDPTQRTHHLLKHCLSQSQRCTALAHFHTSDPREAAKEIARMGQRELQAKFKEVYGNATKSNNNSWLRRKLYEAVGVAPLKAATKGKARKGSSHSSHSRKSKEGASKARSPKVGAIKTKRAADAPSASPPHLPSSGPLSILDLHQHSGLLSNETSDSEDGEAYASHATPPDSLRQSTPSTPSSPLAGLGGTFGPQQALPPVSLGTASACQDLPPRLAPAPCSGFVPLAEPQSPLAAGMHWAEGFPSAPAAQQPCGTTVYVSSEQALPALATDDLSVGLSSAFKPMELEQVQECGSLWDCEPQPWYFGTSMDFGALAMPKPLAMGGDGLPAVVDDDDDIPLLTLDLGGIDVSI